VIHLQNSRDPAQIDGHGVVLREEAQAILLDADLQPIDSLIAVDHGAGQVGPAVAQGPDGIEDPLLDQGRQPEDRHHDPFPVPLEGSHRR
jgi:hypothetical protein